MGKTYRICMIYLTSTANFPPAPNACKAKNSYVRRLADVAALISRLHDA